MLTGQPTGLCSREVCVVLECFRCAAQEQFKFPGDSLLVVCYAGNVECHLKKRDS